MSHKITIFISNRYKILIGKLMNDYKWDIISLDLKSKQIPNDIVYNAFEGLTGLKCNPKDIEYIGFADNLNHSHTDFVYYCNKFQFTGNNPTIRRFTEFKWVSMNELYSMYPLQIESDIAEIFHWNKNKIYDKLNRDRDRDIGLGILY